MGSLARMIFGIPGAAIVTECKACIVLDGATRINPLVNVQPIFVGM